MDRAGLADALGNELVGWGVGCLTKRSARAWSNGTNTHAVQGKPKQPHRLGRLVLVEGTLGVKRDGVDALVDRVPTGCDVIYHMCQVQEPLDDAHPNRRAGFHVPGWIPETRVRLTFTPPSHGNGSARACLSSRWPGSEPVCSQHTVCRLHVVSVLTRARHAANLRLAWPGLARPLRRAASGPTRLPPARSWKPRSTTWSAASSTAPAGPRTCRATMQ